MICGQSPTSQMTLLRSGGDGINVLAKAGHQLEFRRREAVIDDAKVAMALLDRLTIATKSSKTAMKLSLQAQHNPTTNGDQR